MSGARIVLGLVVLAAALAAPLALGPFWVTLVTQIMIFGLLALSADLLLGHAGLFSLCHASFFAVAAYTTAILQVRYGAADRGGGAGRASSPAPCSPCSTAARCAPAASISS